VAITVPDLTPLVYDPTRMQQLILNNMNNMEIMDPTNPFVMLMEAATSLASASAVESVSALRSIYPSLATKPEDLLHHISDRELANVFSHPARSSVIFYISARDLRNNGVRPNNASNVYVTIPNGTEVSVHNTIFTLLNDINVSLYDNGSVFVEELMSPDPVATNSLGILPSGIVTFEDGEPWVMFETLLTQVKKNSVIRPVSVAEGFKLVLSHSDKYHYSEVFYKSSATSNQWSRINTSHSDTYIDPNVPTMFISVTDGTVTYEIPDVYLISGQLSGDVKIVMYETLGSINLPLHKYGTNDFGITISTDITTPSAAAISNIAMVCNSRDNAVGGVTGYTFAELRSSIINNALGHTTLPVTDAQLTKNANVAGFELHKALDIVTERIYIASRSMPADTSNLVYSKPDIYFNSLVLDQASIDNSPVIATPLNIIIPSMTLMMENNGAMRLLTTAESNVVKALPRPELAAYMSNNNLYYSPYHYYIDTKSTSVTETRVFDLDTPVINTIRITGKNINVTPRANIGKYGVVRVADGYELTITVLTNAEFDSIGSPIYGQLTIPTHDNGSVVHVGAVYDTTNKLMTFKLGTNFDIDALGLLSVVNVASPISNPQLSLTHDATIYIYAEDATVAASDSANQYRSNIVDVPTHTVDMANVTVFDVEVLNVRLGRKVDTVWSKLYVTYTDKKYLRHTADKPLVYARNVYEPDPKTGSTTRTRVVNGVTQTYNVLLHKAGDPVLDPVTKAPLYEYRAGDVVLDPNTGLPTIDNTYGIVRHMDMLAVEAEYIMATGTVNTNYVNSIKNVLDSWLYTALPQLSAKVIENTRVLFKSFREIVPVTAKGNSTTLSLPHSVSPKITIYSTTAKYTTPEIDNIRSIAGYIIHKHLDMQTTSLLEINKEIMAALDASVVSVRVGNIVPGDAVDIFTVSDPTTRLGLNKRLDISPTGELFVIYDIVVEVHKV